MTNEEYILDWYKNHIWARPAPSKICDGVGMFAIRDIPKGTSVYDLAPKTVNSWIPYETVVDVLPKGVVDLIVDCQPSVGSKLRNSEFKWKNEYGPLWIYTMKNLNWQTTWYFQNHSDNPNLDAFATDNPRLFVFIANRDIKKGEELFEDYDSYNKDWLEVSKS
ncbi:SET domain-containing protein [bacterium]|nr:SET domain-containing protein [bacterium]